MQYISPVSLLKPLNAEELTKKGIALAKKKMLAEFDLNDGNTIVVNGSELTKNDIINFFEALQQGETLAYHVAVADDPVLLRFLEESVLERGTRFKRNWLYTEQAFIEWINPYFFTSFTSLSAALLSGRLEDEWATLLANLVLMDFTWTEKAWFFIEEIVRTDLKKLDNFNKNKRLKNKSIIEPLVSAGYVWMLQQLPAERFAMLRNEYAQEMMECSILIFNKINQDEGAAIIKNAFLLAVDDSLKEAIAHNHAEMFNIYRWTKRSKEDRIIKRILLILFGIFIVYLVIMGVRDAGTDDSNRNVNIMPGYIPKPGDTAFTLKHLDSINAAIDRQKRSDSLDANNHNTKTRRPASEKK